MIRTKYDVSLEIDDTNFSIVASEANKVQKDDLDNVVEKSRSQYTKRDSIQAELNEISEEFAINKQILEFGTIKEKASVWLDQKKLNKQIFKLQKEIDNIEKDLTSVADSIEKVYKKRYELLIAGSDKVSLGKEIASKGISYQIIFSAIAEKIKAAKEKK